MLNFHQWLEKAARTSTHLSQYPPLYGYAGTHVPLASTPISAGAAGEFARHPEYDISKPKRKKKKK